MSLSDGDGLLARHPLVHYAGAILLVYLRHANEGQGGGRKKKGAKGAAEGDPGRARKEGRRDGSVHSVTTSGVKHGPPGRPGQDGEKKPQTNKKRKKHPPRSRLHAGVPIKSKD